MNNYINVNLITQYFNQEEWNTPDEKWWPEREIGMIINSIPKADVVEVVHGKWVPTRKDSDISFCSNCESYWIIRDDAYDYLYCPKCGAKMEVTE